MLWPCNPWDHGTRREELSDAETFAKLLKEIHGDGINGDTMRYFEKKLWDGVFKADGGPPVMVECRRRLALPSCFRPRLVVGG